jgi:hypothetical protein
LTCWTLITPWTWQRISLDNYDSFGRSVESYGSCVAAPSPPQGATTTSTAADRPHLDLAFLIPIVCVNITALIFASYQAYQACKLQVPAEYSEANTIFFSFAMLLETFIIGLPVILLVYRDPSTSFLIRCILISICCLGVQVPIFLPKFLRLRDAAYRRAMVMSSCAQPPRGGNVHVTINRLSNAMSEAAISPNNESCSSNSTAVVRKGEKCGKPDAKLGVSQVSRSVQYYQQLEINQHRTCSRQQGAGVTTASRITSEKSGLTTCSERQQE